MEPTMGAIWRASVERFANWIQRAIIDLQSTLFVGPLLVGLLLIVVSYFLGIATVTDNGRPGAGKAREVGYFAALNWSFTFCVVLPIAAEIAAMIIRRARDSLRGATADGLLITSQGEPVSPEVADRIWTDLVVQTAALSMVYLIFGEIVFTSLWWDMSGSWLLGAQKFSNLLPAEQVERDWTVAHFLTNGGVNAWLNAGFSLICHMLMAAAWTLFLGVYTFVLNYCIRLYNLAQVNSPSSALAVLVPDLRHEAQEFGYEGVCRLFEQLLLFAGCTVVILMLIRLQNAYLVSTKTSLIELINPGLGEALGAAMGKGFLTGLGSLSGTLLQWYPGDIKTPITILLCALVGSFIIVIAFSMSAFFERLSESAHFMVLHGLAGNIVIPDNLTRAEIRLKALPAARAKAAAPLQILFLLFLLFTLTSVCSISQF
jgi:hypothetical protein